MSVAQLTHGTVFANDFRILEPLAEGGMGAVYIVEQISTSKRRALKLMHAQLVANADLRKRFEQEARIGARIESEHVVEVQAAGIDAQTGMPYLVMELLEGEDLATTMKRRGALTMQEVGAIFLELCHAVGAAHAAGIVHRDLKPENIFLVRAKRAGVAFTVKVLDFGIAKLLAEGTTHQTEAIGSPLWLAPEQTERAEVSPATDVWAIGLIAFYLLTGKFYWKSASQDATVAQLLREILFEPLLPASLRAQLEGSSLPPAFDAWFARCVARDRNARFANARVAYENLAPILSSPLAPPQAYGPPPTPQYGPPPTPQYGPPPTPQYGPPPMAYVVRPQPPVAPLARMPPPPLALTPAATSSTTPGVVRPSRVLVWLATSGIALLGAVALIAYLATRPTTYDGPMLTYDDASEKFAKSMSAAPTIESSAVVSTLRTDPKLKACVADAKVTWVAIKLVMVSGKVAGATTTATPASSTVSDCVNQSLATMSWKADDVAKYDVWLVKRDHDIVWPGY